MALSNDALLTFRSIVTEVRDGKIDASDPESRLFFDLFWDERGPVFKKFFQRIDCEFDVDTSTVLQEIAGLVEVGRRGGYTKKSLKAISRYLENEPLPQPILDQDFYCVGTLEAITEKAIRFKYGDQSCHLQPSGAGSA